MPPGLPPGLLKKRSSPNWSWLPTRPTMPKLIHRIENVRYHRNGLSGAGFFLVQFRYKDGRKLRNMVGVVFMDYDDSTEQPVPGKIGGGIAVAIYDPERPNERWRGDLFANELYAAIQKWDE